MIQNSHRWNSANWNFEHDTSSPEFAQADSIVGIIIQTAKRPMLKCIKTGDDKYLVFLSLHTVPGKENSFFTNTKLMKRELWTLLASVTEPIYRDKVQKQTIPKHHELLPLNIGDYFRLHDGKTWSRRGKVIKRCDQLTS